MGELAGEADHEHCLSRAGMSFYPEQSARRTIRSAIVPICERCVLRGAKDPLIRVIEQLILILLDPFDIVLRINDVDISAARCLDIIPAGVLLRRDEALKRLMDTAEPRLHSFGITDKLSEKKSSSVLGSTGPHPS